eukprot:2688832-Pleurochrysis_carterae.AAC.1
MSRQRLQRREGRSAVLEKIGQGFAPFSEKSCEEERQIDECYNTRPRAKHHTGTAGLSRTKEV